MLYKKLLPVVLIGLGSLSLTSCGTPSVIKEYVYVHDDLPTALLADCPGYDGPLVNNGDLAQAYITERQGLRACNADKEALREWDAKRMAEPKPSGK
mgnify:CR=1 FL=1